MSRGQKGPPSVLAQRGVPCPRHWLLGGPDMGPWTQPLSRAKTGTGGRALSPRAPLPLSGRAGVRQLPTRREAPSAAAHACLAAGTWLCCGFSPCRLWIFWGPLLYLNACFYGNIYGARVARKTPS